MLAVVNKLLDLLLAVLPKSKNTSLNALESPQTSDQDIKQVTPQLPEENAMAITLEAYFEDSKTGEDRRVKYAKDYTNEILENAKTLLEKVNAFLQDLGVMSARVSSGWRPPSVNASVPGSAKRSLHMTGKAIDIVDTSGELDKLIMEKEQDLLARGQPSLLKKYDLWLEHPDHTRTWCHLDIGNRTDRPLRVFKI